MEQQFEPIQAKLVPLHINLNTVAANKYVTDIEQHNRTIQEHMCCNQLSLHNDWWR